MEWVLLFDSAAEIGVKQKLKEIKVGTFNSYILLCYLLESWHGPYDEYEGVRRGQVRC